MNHTLTSNYPTEPDEKIVALNQDIGYLLLKYLKGLDVISFMEAIDGSEQFNMIEISEDHLFYKVFMKIVKEEKMKINVPYLHFYLDTCSIDEHGYLYPERYHSGETPILRLFIHPTFTVEAFENLCFTYKTPSFQCYSRLLPLNTYTYVGNFLLLDYFHYKGLIGCPRELNAHERRLFKECLFFRTLQSNILNKQISFVASMTEFMKNFENRFKSSVWIEAIDFTKFHISGGCIVNSLCEQPFPDTTTEQIDINFNGNSFNEFDEAVANLQFNFKDVPEITNPMSYVLHSSDIDISQVAFTGSHVFCTIAFLQAIATNSFICYTMHGDMERSICERIIRYCQRGFVFLEPQEFDNALYIDIMARNVLKEKREETREIMNDDGEIQIITITYEPRQFPYPNVDSHRLQETFIEQICRKKIK
ncbi:unnamed protein product [Rotaria socialis]|uniref:Uncharacterized protein n=1 Tax=Rotaria socialis TaxID=392032 RepID=A0A820YXW4_9BILA|nr:unnamed protein product [Rotaria socialis]CAF4552930.1 unnamed protein product [Rotaria socialis]